MRKPPLRPPTPESLAKAALDYLARYAASESALRHVLENRIRRAALRSPEFAEDRSAQDNLRRAIESIVERHRKSGVLNDQAFAGTKLFNLRRMGGSRRAIHQKLSQAGIGKSIIDGVLAGEEDGAEVEMKAALAFVRRRRLGMFRVGRKSHELYPELQRKDLAALARAGFSLAIARRALNQDGKAGLDVNGDD